MKYPFPLLLLLTNMILVFYSCNEVEKVNLPLSDTQMTDLVVDMHYLEGILLKVDKTQKDSITKAIKSKIINIYDIENISDLDSLLIKAQSYHSYFKDIQDKATIILDSLDKSYHKIKID